MQVDRKPSPWPCVAMLIALLLVCLTVPLYWQSDKTPRDVASGNSDDLPAAAFSSIVPGCAARSLLGSATAIGPYVPGFADVNLGLPAGLLADNSLLSLCPPPTIEELIAAARVASERSNEGRGRHNPNFANWPMFAPPSTVSAESPWPKVDIEPLPAAVPGPLVGAALRHVGRAVAQYSPAEIAPRFVFRAMELYQRWSPAWTAADQRRLPTASTWRLIGPDDRLAMLPTPPQDEFIEPQPTRSLTRETDEWDDPSDADAWCVPRVLLEQLQRLAQHPYSAQWAEATMAQLRTLTDRDGLDGDDVHALLVELAHSTQEAARLADDTGDDRLRVELLRAHWGLARRLDCWSVVHDIRIAAQSRGRAASRGSLSSMFGDVPPRPVARTELPTFTSDLETYERTRDPQLARQVAQERRALESSDDSLDQALADAVEQHYRNANVRIAITAEMLNRFVASERTEMQSVYDRIAGTPVRGQSHTLSESRVRLEPATGRWQLGIEAEGVVKSNTLADGGQARLRSYGATNFTAQKSVVVDPNGVWLQPTVVGATNHNRLVGVTTDFDWVPLFGSYARNRAMVEYRAKRPRAKAEVEFKVAARASDQVDRETREAVDRVEQDVRQRFTDRLADFGIDLTPVELTTTQERVVARLRVAGDQQLGSHTPRPRALSDSLASVQVHETALTNAAVSLALDGRSYTAPELQTMLREKFPRLALENSLEATRDTVFHFTEQDAVQFRIIDGRLEVMLALASLQQEGRQIRNFVVHAFYAPVVDGLNAELVRDGALGIEGRFSSGDRARLHNVFNSVLAAERRLPIVRLADPVDPRLDGLMITQLVLEDGWVGLAVGPQDSGRVAERSRSLR